MGKPLQNRCEAHIYGTGWYMAGILLPGVGVIISAIMLHSEDFSKVTAYAGLIGNGLDLIQHVLYPFAPSISGIFQQGMGVFPGLVSDAGA